MTDAIEGESESTWARLTRRKAVQWGIAYAATARPRASVASPGQGGFVQSP